jgi:hypothetical protein
MEAANGATILEMRGVEGESYELWRGVGAHKSAGYGRGCAFVAEKPVTDVQDERHRRHQRITTFECLN